MKKNYIIVLALVVIAIITSLIFSLFEYKEVSDLRWNTDFHYDSKEAYGTHIFRSLLEHRFDQVPIYRYGLDEVDPDASNVLFLGIGAHLSFDWEGTEELLNLISKGNNALLICQDLRLSENETYFALDAIEHQTKEAVSIDYLHEEQPRLYKHYYRTFDKEKSIEVWGKVDSIYNNRGTVLGTCDDLIIYDKTSWGYGHLYVHHIPFLFTNQASRQPFFKEHFEQIMAEFSPDVIILDHPSFRDANRRNSDSPLQFILSQKSLRTAYYSLLFLAVLYVLFKSKRRQKMIPTLEPNINTSLEYVQALGSLMYKQRRHDRIVKHLKNIFIHRVKEKFYLNLSDPNFASQLAKKSNLPKEHIENIVFEFDRAEKKLNVGEKHLMIIYQLLDHFYKHIRHDGRRTPRIKPLEKYNRSDTNIIDHQEIEA